MRLCNNAKKLITYTSKPQFKESIIIADDLVAVLLDKDVVTLDKPSYIGQAVLDLSKLRMYELNYVELEMYRQQFNCEINIIAGDTDSFFLECRDVDLRSQLLPAMIANEQLDTSNYDVNDPLYSCRFSAVIGKFKDESKGCVHYQEGVFLRPKSYALKTQAKPVMKCKGINLNQTDIQFQSYLQLLKS